MSNAEAFVSNDLTLDIPDLTDADLKDIGVGTMGDRKRLLRAIASLATAKESSVVVATAAGPSPTDAERRQATVMFSDLVGSTALAARMDAMACSSTSAIRRRMRTTPNEQYGRDWS
jgi:class 3 adenylate cyclase